MVINLYRAGSPETPENLIRTVTIRDIHAMPNAQVEYLECVHPDRLEAVASLDAPALFATAVRFSRARLIDNRLVGGA